MPGSLLRILPFFNGNTLKQNPLASIQLHGIFAFKPGIWAAISMGKSFMGETELNGIPKDDARTGARYGADFTSVILAYQFLWFDNRSSD